MSWQYFRKGKLVNECNDLPESVEDAAIELEANGVDTSDCLVKPLTPEEEQEYFEVVKVLKEEYLQTTDDFIKKLNKRIAKECKVSLSQRFTYWCRKWYLKIFR